MEYKENLSNEINDFGNEVHNDSYSSIDFSTILNEKTFNGSSIYTYSNIAYEKTPSFNTSEVIFEEDSPYLDMDEIPEIKIRNEDGRNIKLSKKFK